MPSEKPATSSINKQTPSYGKKSSDVKRMGKFDFIRKAGGKIKSGMTGRGRRRLRIRNKRRSDLSSNRQFEKDESGYDEESILSFDGQENEPGSKKIVNGRKESSVSIRIAGITDVSGIFNYCEAILRKFLVLFVFFALGATLGPESLGWVSALTPSLVMCWMICLLAKTVRWSTEKTPVSSPDL